MATTNSTLETLLNERDVARITGMSLASVRRWRRLNRGPRWVRLGAAIRYSPKALKNWLESCPAGGEGIPEKELAL
jgi:predicted DNA-binding transcriptional regulator AlpA